MTNIGKAFLGAVLITLVAVIGGGFFSGVYWVADRLTHGAREAIFAPYFALAFLGAMLLGYSSESKS